LTIKIIPYRDVATYNQREFIVSKELPEIFNRYSDIGEHRLLGRREDWVPGGRSGTRNELARL
jgi:hypothetical protein